MITGGSSLSKTLIIMPLIAIMLFALVVPPMIEVEGACIKCEKLEKKRSLAADSNPVITGGNATGAQLMSEGSTREAGSDQVTTGGAATSGPATGGSATGPGATGGSATSGAATGGVGSGGNPICYSTCYFYGGAANSGGATGGAAVD